MLADFKITVRNYHLEIKEKNKETPPYYVIKSTSLWTFLLIFIFSNTLVSYKMTCRLSWSAGFEKSKICKGHLGPLLQIFEGLHNFSRAQIRALGRQIFKGLKNKQTNKQTNKQNSIFVNIYRIIFLFQKRYDLFRFYTVYGCFTVGWITLWWWWKSVNYFRHGISVSKKSASPAGPPSATFEGPQFCGPRTLLISTPAYPSSQYREYHWLCSPIYRPEASSFYSA